MAASNEEFKQYLISLSLTWDEYKCLSPESKASLISKFSTFEARRGNKNFHLKICIIADYST